MLYVRSCPPLSSGRSLPGLTQSIFTIRLPLPADSFVSRTAIRAANSVEIDEVDHFLVRSQPAAQFLAVHPRRHHDHFGFADHLRPIVAQNLAEMRNFFFDVLAIRSDQAAHGDVFVPDE